MSRKQTRVFHLFILENIQIFHYFFVTIFVSIRQKSDLQNVELSLFCDDLVRLDGSVNVLFNIDTVRCFSLTNQRTKNLTHYIVLNFQSYLINNTGTKLTALPEERYFISFNQCGCHIKIWQIKSSRVTK